MDLLTDPSRLLPVTGARLASSAAGIRYRDRDDLVLIEVPDGTAFAATFTRNAFCAAPVTVARDHLRSGSARYLLINAGNANAGTGAAGTKATLATCALVAEATGVGPQQVLPFSTGVISELLPVRPFAEAIPGLVDNLDENYWAAAARAIMTTDTVAKVASIRVDIDGQPVTLTGMAKGSGMIKPDMATMLAFIGTDARVETGLLQQFLDGAVSRTFNRITVDGDTSTNDACVLFATGQGSGRVLVAKTSESYAVFRDALEKLCLHLAQAIVRDGEGATRFVAVEVGGGASEEECLQVAFTVAHSPLVKTALFAGDPNWGRILAAVGRSGIDALDVGKVSLWLDDVQLLANGEPHPEYTESRGAAVMQQNEITIRVDLARGSNSATVWTSDLSYDYVKINAEYRS